MRCACKEPNCRIGRILCGSRCPDDEGNRWVYRHRRERIYLGPDTGEIILHLHRNYEAGLREGLNVVLKIRRHRCVTKDKCGNIIDDVPEAELRPYAFEKDAYHFPIEGEFFTDATKFPKGFYIGSVMIDDCVVDTIEIVRSPGVWVGEALGTTGRCLDPKVFVDDYCPVKDCLEEEKEKKKKKCRKLCEPEIVIAKKVDNPMYVPDLSEILGGEDGTD